MISREWWEHLAPKVMHARLTNHGREYTPGRGRRTVWIANAYVDCAIRLCESLVEDEFDRSLHHYCVPLHLTHLAIELYLKSGICLGGQKFKPTHDLDKLQKQYNQAGLGIIFPIPRYLDQFIVRSEDLFTDDPAPTSAWHFERFRYNSDRNGIPFPELQLASLQQLKKELEELHKAGMRIQQVIWKRKRSR